MNKFFFISIIIAICNLDTSLGATFSIDIDVGPFGGSADRYSGIVEVSDIPIVSTVAGLGTRHSFPLTSLTISGPEGNQSWTENELAGFDLQLDDNRTSSVDSIIIFEAFIPMPTGISGSTLPIVMVFNAGWDGAFGTPPIDLDTNFGQIDSTDIGAVGTIPFNAGSTLYIGGLVDPESSDPAGGFVNEQPLPVAATVVSITPIPEPSNIVLLGLAIVGSSLLTRCRC